MAQPSATEPVVNDVKTPPKPAWRRRLLPVWLRGLIWVDETRDFEAFLSYTQTADAEIATVIQSVLQNFLRPWYKTRSRNIFRDLSSLPAGEDLLKALAERLDSSRHLIVLAGPAAAISAGMEFEARHWFARERKGSVVVVVTHGEFESWVDRMNQVTGETMVGIKNGALPPAMRENLQAVPLYIDVRKHREAMLNRPDDENLRIQLVEDMKQLLLLFYPGSTWERLRREERALRRSALRLFWSFVTVILAVIAVAARFWMNAQEQGHQATENARIAQEQRRQAQENARMAQDQKIEAEKNAEIARKQQTIAELQTQLAQQKEREGYRNEIAQLNLPPGIYGAPALESLEIDNPPITRLDWIRPPLRSLKITINEDGTPNEFPPFLTELTIVGHADNTSTRYYVEPDQLPRMLSSLTLTGVHLRNPERLHSLDQLRTLSFIGTYLPGGELPELPPRLECLTLSGDESTGVDARSLPSSLVFLSTDFGLGNEDALRNSNIKELHTNDIDLLARLPKSITALSLAIEKLDPQKLRILRDTKVENLVVEVRDKARDQNAEVFDIEWLPKSIRELSLTNLAVVHDSSLSGLTELTKITLNRAPIDLTALPSSLHDASLDCGISVDDLKSLPQGLRSLALPCLGEFPKATKLLRRFPSLSTFTALELSDEVDFKLLPGTLKRLAIGVAPAALSETAIPLKELQELTLDLTSDTGGSERPGSAARTNEPVEANVEVIDIKDLPRSLTKLRLTNLRLAHAEGLAAYDGLVELTIDHYNRGTIGIPRTLRKLIVKDVVSSDDLRAMVGFR